MKKIGLGNYDNLAKSYSKFRPSYSGESINFLKILIPKKDRNICLDLGAGTGIFSRKLCKIFNKVYAAEVSKSMIIEGQKFKNKNIIWINTKAEKIAIRNKSFNLVTAASCFHWFDNRSLAKRLIPLMTKNSFLFIIYNSRNTMFDKFSRSVEKKLRSFNTSFFNKRISSGQSPNTLKKINRFVKISKFTKPIIFNLTHLEKFSKKKYIGAWLSSNEARARMGERNFKVFIDWLNKTINPKMVIKTQYVNTCFILQKNY